MSTEPILNTEAFEDFGDHDEATNPVGPGSDLSVASALRCKDPLVFQIDDALKKRLSQAGMKISAGLEMKHVLLLFVKEFHDLSKDLQHRKEEWIGRLRTTIGESGQKPATIRELTGQVVVRHLEAAPWGLRSQPGASRCDTAHTILAIHAGMVRFLRKLSTELDNKAAEDLDLKRWDVEEMASEDEEELTQQNGLSTGNSSGSRTDGVAQTAATKGRTRQTPAQSPAPWTTKETLSLLKTFRDNTAATNEDIATQHNAVCWAGSKVRTGAAARQQLKKHMGLGRRREWEARLQAKIEELEAQ